MNVQWTFMPPNGQTTAMYKDVQVQARAGARLSRRTVCPGLLMCRDVRIQGCAGARLARAGRGARIAQRQSEP